jgi:TolB-like protein/Flp pilus assembly protein TadD
VAADRAPLSLPTGDGVALVFSTSPDAPVRCAVQIARGLAQLPEPIPVRMGIHSGPVSSVADLNDRANFAGAGINIAQRVMDCGDAGHILVSERVASDLTQYREWQACVHDIGVVEAKHGLKLHVFNVYGENFGNAAKPAKIRRSRRLPARIARSPRRAALVAAMIAAVAVAILLLPRMRHTSMPDGDKSIAVLPFENASNDPNAEYLSEGISEALINSLTELQQLRVIARSTAFHYKGKDVDPRRIGRELKVTAVLTGKVRQMQDALTVQVDLVDAATGAQLWGAGYDRKISDVVAVKQAIAREVTEKLKLKLSGEEQRRLVKRDSTNAEAYRFYLRGRYLLNTRTPDGIRQAVEQFQQAIDEDPNFALGYTGLADSFMLLQQYAGVPSREAMPKARAAADRALQIDDSLAEAHTSSAYAYQLTFQWALAEQEYRRAIALNPNYPQAHHWFCVYYYPNGRLDDAQREIKRAQELDPLSPIININVAIVFLLKNEIDAAIEQCQKIIELDPNHPLGHEWLGWARFKQRRYAEAIAGVEKAAALSGRSSPQLSNLGCVYAVAGRRAEALGILKELEERYARREAIGQYLAGIYSSLGDNDRAFAWLEKDFAERSGDLPTIKWRPQFEQLRRDPRYADLIRRMGLNP